MGGEKSHAPLTPGNQRWMAECREWVADAFEGADDYDTNPGTKLRVIEAVLAEVRPGETWKLQALGVVLGDAIGLAYGYPWVQVADGLDAVPALLLSEVPEPVYAYPVTMISKRAEAGQTLDFVALVELAENVAHAVGRRR
ncbi:DUF3806 domain-containing protein [Propionicicella superfundia]|uniref:DUF3806 domain-containing protein n=1 Tax=Propionicicella superfundia TaxID=348582 RepID=UPI00040AB4C9|nr:DUF3806 domain-containing protein [Propionicicella superfundia]